MRHSFCYGDDFNFFVVTDNSITLYDLNLFEHTPKTVKQIPIPGHNFIACHYEPMANTLLLVDGGGCARVFFLNMHKTSLRPTESKLEAQFNLEIAVATAEASDD
jgi:hypothetical protein